MIHALHLRACPYDPYDSPAYVFPMEKEQACHIKTEHDKYCNKQYSTSVIRDSAKGIITVIQIPQSAQEAE